MIVGNYGLNYMHNGFVENKNGWKIKSLSGYDDFAGVSTMGHKKLYQISFDDGSCIDASKNHVFFTEDLQEISTKELNVGTKLMGSPSIKSITNIEYKYTDQTYDIIECASNMFFANGVLCHNCEFISTDLSLFDTRIIKAVEKKYGNLKPAFTMEDQIFYKPISQEMAYLVGVDPATGSGLDFSVIEVFEFPSMQQVMEFRSNTVSEVVLYSHLKKVIGFLEKYSNDVYFSVENNGVGRAIIALYMQDDKPPQYAHFMSEPGKNKLGYTTTSTSKKDCAIRFKNMFERDEFIIFSKILYAEMKNYVRKGDTFEAQKGSTDDCISALYVILRMLTEIAMYDPRAYAKLYRFAEQASGDEWYTDPEYDDLPLTAGVF